MAALVNGKDIVEVIDAVDAQLLMPVLSTVDAREHLNASFIPVVR